MLIEPVNAQEEIELLNPIDCLNAIEHLDLRFRAHLEIQCLALPVENCELHSNPLQCLTKLNQTMRDYFTKLRPMLSDKIQGEGFAIRGYERALSRLDDDFANAPSCEAATGEEFQFCQLVILGAGIAELFYRARQAGVPTP